MFVKWGQFFSSVSRVTKITADYASTSKLHCFVNMSLLWKMLSLKLQDKHKRVENYFKPLAVNKKKQNFIFQVIHVSKSKNNKG